MLLSVVATLTSKGQLTLPKAIRDALGLREGDRVRFELDQGKVALEHATGTAGVADHLVGLAARERGCMKLITFDARLARTGLAELPRT